MSIQPAKPDLQRSQYWLWLGPLLFMLAVGLYAISRYDGHWAEADSATFSVLIRSFIGEGRLVPRLGPLYPNGYAFQAISTFILALTGLELPALQQLVYPLLSCTVVLPAWILYRELAGGARAATIAVLLLFTQPEFLFVILRSSHEKFTRTLMLMCLYFLVRSFTLGNRPRLFIANVGLFYLMAFAFIASNNLLAHSFIVALAVAVALGWALERRVVFAQRQSGPAIRRLLYATLISLGIVYIFSFYVYTPAQHDLLVIKDTWERVRDLFLPQDTQAADSATYTNSYAYVSTGWISLPIYFLVSIANWIILGVSFVIWLRQGWRWLWRGEAPETRATWLLWLFYAAFAFQGALSVVADASGALGSNMQHRLFPSVSIVAVGIVSAALAHWRPQRFALPIQLGLSAVVFCIAILSVMKATNEPLVSNKWTFYRPEELTALEWGNQHLANSGIGTEYDERLAVAYDMAIGEPRNHNSFRIFYSTASVRNMVLSAISRLRSSRLGVPLPVPPDAMRVYDNGEAEMYHLRPQTPHQK